MKKETTKRTVTVYVAKDGTKFDSDGACKRYEEELKREQTLDYLEDHSVEMWGDCDSGGISGYLGANGGRLYLIKVNKKLVKLLGESVLLDEDDIGTYEFFSNYGDDIIYPAGDIEGVIEDMENDIKFLKKFVKKNS